MWSLGLVASAFAGAFPYPIEHGTLPNGLQWYAVPMPTPGVASVYTWMSVGSRDELDVGRTGFAHFFEHLWFYGTKELGGEARENAVVQLGAEENAWTWLDETVYHMTVSSDRVPDALRLQGTVFQGLFLTADDVRKESGAVYGEFRKGQANPDGRLSETLQALVFTRHSYGHDTIGYEADIKAMPSAFDYANAFFARFYRPGNATVIVAGDVSADAVRAEVEKQFGGWTASTTVRPVPPVEPVQTAPRSAHVDWPTATAPRLTLAWPIPGHRADDKRLASLELAAAVLLSPVGPLERRLVREEGLAYDVGGGRDSFVDACLFQISVTAKEDADLSRIEVIVNEEIVRLVAGVDAAVLDGARTRLVNEFVSGLDTPDAAAAALGWALRRDPAADAIDRWQTQLESVGPADLSANVSQFLTPLTRNKVTLTGPKEDR